MEIRKDIQLLRGLAVLLVVLFHLQTPWFANGFLGVDIFFVISGFLMAKLYDRGTAIDFYKRRLDRLFPAYVVAILSTLVCAYFFLIPVDFNQLFEQSLAGVSFVSNFFYWNQNSYFDKAAFNPLLNLWSLAVEVQFYVLVPFLYPLIRSRKWLFHSIFLASLISCFAIQTVSPKTSFFFTPFRIWEFLIGAWVAWESGHYRGSPAKGAGYLQVALLSFLVLFTLLIDLKPDATGTLIFGHPALPALIITLLTGGVIKLGLPSAILTSVLGRSLSTIGDYSYSIYLIHFPAIVLLNYVPFGGTRLAFDDLSPLLFAIILIGVFSASSYAFIEKRFSTHLNRMSVRVSLVLLVLGAAVGLRHLNWSRYSDAEKNIFSAWADRAVYRCGKIFRVLNPTELICDVRTTGSGGRILLVGNSHADSIKKVVADVGIAAGISTYFVVSNEPLMGGGPTAEQLISAAVRHEIGAIVLHYSNIYEGEKNLAGILNLIELAQQQRIQIFLIGPVPSYAVHIPKAMFGDIHRSNDFAITLLDHRKKTAHYRDFADVLPSRGVTVLDPALLLCPVEGKCLFSTTDLKPYYFDSSHLTLTGASVLKPLFLDLFKRLTGG